MPVGKIDTSGQLIIPKRPKAVKENIKMKIEKKKKEVAEEVQALEQLRPIHEEIIKHIIMTQKPKREGIAYEQAAKEFQNNKLNLDEFVERLQKEGVRKPSPEEVINLLKQKQIVDASKAPKAAAKAPAAKAPAAAKAPVQQPPKLLTIADLKTAIKNYPINLIDRVDNIVASITGIDQASSSNIEKKLVKQVQTEIDNYKQEIEDLKILNQTETDANIKSKNQEIIDESDKLKKLLLDELNRAKSESSFNRGINTVSLKFKNSGKRINYGTEFIADLDNIKDIDELKVYIGKIQSENQKARSDIPKDAKERNRMTSEQIKRDNLLTWANDIYNKIKEKQIPDNRKNEAFLKIKDKFKKVQSGQGLFSKDRLDKAREAIQKLREGRAKEQEIFQKIRATQKPKRDAIEANAILNDFYTNKLSLLEVEELFRNRIGRELTAKEQASIIETKKLVGDELTAKEAEQFKNLYIPPTKSNLGSVSGKTSHFNDEIKKVNIMASTPTEKKRLNILLKHIDIKPGKGDKVNVGKKETGDLSKALQRFIKNDRQAQTRSLNDDEKEVVKQLKAAFLADPSLKKDFSKGLVRSIENFQSGKGFNMDGMKKKKETSIKIENSKMERVLLKAALDMADIGKPDAALSLAQSVSESKKRADVINYIEQFL